MGSLTAQERKESEEPLAVEEEPGRYVWELPFPVFPGEKVLMPRVQVGPVPMVQILRISHLPLSVSSSVRCRSQDCLMLCLLKPKDRG